MSAYRQLVCPNRLLMIASLPFDQLHSLATSGHAVSVSNVSHGPTAIHKKAWRAGQVCPLAAGRALAASGARSVNNSMTGCVMLQ